LSGHYFTAGWLATGLNNYDGVLSELIYKVNLKLLVSFVYQGFWLTGAALSSFSESLAR
jgi:hypothetical protein